LPEGLREIVEILAAVSPWYCPVKKPVQLNTIRKRSGNADRWYKLVLSKQEDKLRIADTTWYYLNKKISYQPFLQLVLSKQVKLPTAGTA
jgi:hypothetical protein